jgi:DNA repair exonuclease SbcCD ATPase subunit
MRSIQIGTIGQESAMMTSGFTCVGVGRWVAVLILGLCVATASPVPAAAQSRGDADALTPVEEYARQVEQLTKSAPDLARKIEDTTKAIDEATDAAAAREQIEQLRSVISNLLGQVADNGAVAQLGAKALTHARTKLQALDHESRYKPEERQFLIEEWRKLLSQTEQATNDLESARTELAGLLRTLQAREDFIDELLQLRRAAEAINVMRQLTSEIRVVSDKLRSLISGIKPPGV